MSIQRVISGAVICVRGSEMKAGKAPLRTFGDLKQFYELKEAAPPDEPDKSADA